MSWQDRQALNIFIWFHTHGEARRQKGQQDTIECLLCKDERDQGHRKSVIPHSKLHSSHPSATKQVKMRLTREDLEDINMLMKKLKLRLMDTNPALDDEPTFSPSTSQETSSKKKRVSTTTGTQPSLFVASKGWEWDPPPCDPPQPSFTVISRSPV